MLEKIKEKIGGYSGTPPVEELRKVAVLIAVTDGPEPELIYTLRSNKVGSMEGRSLSPVECMRNKIKTLDILH